MKLEILHGNGGLEAVKDAWRELTDSQTATSLSQLVEYYLAYVRAFDVPDHELLIAIVKDSADRILAILPLRRSTKKVLAIQLRILEFPDVPVPIRDMVIDSSRPAENIVEFLLKSIGDESSGAWDYLQLRDVPEDSALLVTRNGEQGRLQLTQEVGFSHYLDVSKQDYVANVLNSNTRNNLRRNRKKIEKLGRLEFRTVTSFPELEIAFEQFLTTEAAGWKSLRGGKRAVKLHADQTQFYYDFMRRLAEKNRCHIHLLLIDDQPVASDYCVVSGEKSFSVKHGYDETYSRFAPGNLLRAYTIDYYEESAQIRCLDLVSGWDWHSRWRPEKNGLFDIKIFSNSLRGRFLYYLAHLRQTNAIKKDRGQ